MPARSTTARAVAPASTAPWVWLKAPRFARPMAVRAVETITGCFMRLLEVVVADRTAPEVVATGFALAKRLGKIAVRAGVCDGFIGNRILAVYGGASRQHQVDALREGVDDTYQLQQNIRRVVGRWVNTAHRRRPMIIPVVLEA